MGDAGHWNSPQLPRAGIGPRGTCRAGRVSEGDTIASTWLAVGWNSELRTGVLSCCCVAPCLPLGSVSSMARARSSRGTATVDRRWPRGLPLNEAYSKPLCVAGRGSFSPARVYIPSDTLGNVLPFPFPLGKSAG